MNKLTESKNKIKEWWANRWLDTSIFIAIILVATALFGLWRLDEIKQDKAPIHLIN